MRRPSPLAAAPRGALAAVLVAAALLAAPASAAVTAEPATVALGSGPAAEVAITWTFEREELERVVSEEGQLIGFTDLAPLEVVRVPLEVKLKRGAGAVVERLRVTPAQLARLRERGLSRLRYVRLFGRSEGAVTVELAAAGPVAVEGVELSFAGGAAEVAVARRGRVPTAVAVLRYQGAGPLEVAWEVDGVVHARVTQALDLRGTARLESPELPPLPTDAPGPHRLRLVPARAATGLTLPALTYRVGEGAAVAAPPPAPLGLAGPAEGAVLPFEAVRLDWQRGRGAVYLVDLRDCDSGAIHHTAYTREPPYRLPAFGVAKSLVVGSQVCWRVLGFDGAGALVEASEVRRLRIRAPAGAP